METVLLTGLASLLLERWKKSPLLKGDRKRLLFDADQDPIVKIMSGLAILVDLDNPLKILLKNAEKPEDIDLEKIEEAIKRFQNTNEFLTQDGIMGIRTLAEVLKSALCPTILTRPQEELSDDAKTNLEFRRKQDGRHWYFYYVEELPKIKGASSRALLDRAWAEWMKSAGFRAQPLRNDERELANVIIRVNTLPGNVLGQAHVGDPPGQFSLLELEMDDRVWEPRLFFNAVAHEIGHIVGLNHTAPGFLMSEVIPNDMVLGPTDHDIDLVREIHGPAPA